MDKTVTSDRYGAGWVEREDNIMRALYPSGGSTAVAGKLPHRTKRAIEGRARALELRAPGRWGRVA
jgi:hypothetical protein